MEAAVAASLINQGGNVLDTLGNWVTGGATLDKNYSQWKKAFNYEANYNSPVNQMKRLEDAGLNANLMYGQGSTGNVTGHAAPQMEAPKSSVNINPLDYLGQYSQIRLAQAQADNLAEMKRLNQQKVTSEVLNQNIKDMIYQDQVLKYSANTAGELKRNKYLFDALRDNVSIGLQNQKIQASTNLLNSQNDLAKTQNSIGQFRLKNELPKRLDLLDSQTWNLKDMVRSRKYQDEQTELFGKGFSTPVQLLTYLLRGIRSFKN